MESYPIKSFGYVIPNTKALKNLIIFENFAFFWDLDYVETRKHAKNFALEVWREAAEIYSLDCYFIYHKSEENLSKSWKYSIFQWYFDNFAEIWIITYCIVCPTKRIFGWIEKYKRFKNIHRGEAELRINCEQKKKHKRINGLKFKKFQIFTEISQFLKYADCVK